MNRRIALALVTIAAAALLLGGCGGHDAQARGEATLTIHFSRFEPATLTVSAGVPVTITLKNDDPIEHEWIVGSDRVHARHRTGTEPYHDTRPTEVTIPALATRETTVTFDKPGEYSYICHLPGHEAYGMVGTLTIT